MNLGLFFFVGNICGFHINGNLISIRYSKIGTFTLIQEVNKLLLNRQNLSFVTKTWKNVEQAEFTKNCWEKMSVKQKNKGYLAEWSETEADGCQRCGRWFDLFT